MMKIKYLLVVLCASFALSTFAEKLNELWVSGSAVPSGVQKITCSKDNLFKLTGALKAGDLKIQTTEKVSEKTKYLVPMEENAILVNNGASWRLESNPQSANWQVLFDEEHYRITINPEENMLKGEVVMPWNELFIGGGATQNGWDRFHMQAFKQDESNPYLWVWIGDLRKNEKSEEPFAFKLEGQLDWGPKQLHPMTDGEDVLKSTQFRMDGPDTKWRLAKEGHYRICVNLLTETIKAEYLGK